MKTLKTFAKILSIIASILSLIELYVVYKGSKKKKEAVIKLDEQYAQLQKEYDDPNTTDERKEEIQKEQTKVFGQMFDLF